MLEVSHTVIDPWSIHRQLLVVDTNTMTMSIWVAEEARLQEWVSRRLNTWGDMSRVERGLFNFGEIVL